MNLTNFLLQLFGFMWVIIGVAFILNSKYYYEKMAEIVDNFAVIFIGGLLTLISGISIVKFHNLWSTPSEIIVSVIGWLALLKGIILFIAPTSFKTITNKLFCSNKSVIWYGVIVFILGLILLCL